MKEYTEQELKENHLRNEGYVNGVVSGKREMAQEIWLRFQENGYDNREDCDNKSDKGECIMNDILSFLQNIIKTDEHVI